MDHASTFPVVLARASGARVRDVDGNHYVDLTGFFGAALVGHRNPAVVRALRVQAGRLLHAMGDVHPADVKARYLRQLCRRMPAQDYRAILSLNGSDAVESALKLAACATGRPGVIAFRGSYHGLSAGALEVTHGEAFRGPFRKTLADRAVFLPFPAADGSDADPVLRLVRDCARTQRTRLGPVGAVIVEPIQGRGGFRVPPQGFLAGLARVAAEAGLVLIADEVYTGAGRTGRFLAGDRDGLVPDVVCMGKALGGGMPLSACLLRPRVADAVRAAGGEAVHTSTFLGHPLACAAGLAVLAEIDRRDLPAEAVRIGGVVRRRAEAWKERWPIVRDVRGAGAMVGVELGLPDGSPATSRARAVLAQALRRGVILLTEGEAGNVLAFTPPLVIADHDLAFALDTVEECLAGP